MIIVEARLTFTALGGRLSGGESEGEGLDLFAASGASLGRLERGGGQRAQLVAGPTVCFPASRPSGPPSGLGGRLRGLHAFARANGARLAQTGQRLSCAPLVSIYVSQRG